MDSGTRRAFGEFMGRVYETSDATDRQDAEAWTVVCLDLEEPVSVVACYGRFDTPEEALVAAGRLEATSLHNTHLAAPGEAGWSHVVTPIFPIGGDH